MNVWIKILLSWGRAALASGAGVLVTNGYLTGSQADQLQGGAVVLIVLILSAWDKFHAKAAVIEAAKTGVVK